MASILFISQLTASSLSDSLNIRITDQQGHLLREALVYDQDYMVLAKANDRGVYRLSKSYPALDTIVITSFGYSTRSFSYTTLLERENHEIRLSYLSDQLEEILVVGRFDQAETQQSHTVQSIASREFTRTQSATTADALDQHSDVFVQKSQFGGGSPIVRGFEASRVLLVVDGVRMNNLIYRSGHLQNAITIDPSALAQMEVIYGPGSLLYGSDALGGVIHFRTQDPILRFANQKKISGTAAVRYASAASGLTSHVDLNVGGEKVAYFGSLTFSDFKDLKAGSSVIEKYPEFGLRQFFVDPSPTGDLIVRNTDEYLQ